MNFINKGTDEVICEYLEKSMSNCHIELRYDKDGNPVHRWVKNDKAKPVKKTPSQKQEEKELNAKWGLETNSKKKNYYYDTLKAKGLEKRLKDAISNAHTPTYFSKHSGNGAVYNFGDKEYSYENLSHLENEGKAIGLLMAIGGKIENENIKMPNGNSVSIVDMIKKTDEWEKNGGNHTQSKHPLKEIVENEWKSNAKNVDWKEIK